MARGFNPFASGVSRETVEKMKKRGNNTRRIDLRSMSSAFAGREIEDVEDILTEEVGDNMERNWAERLAKTIFESGDLRPLMQIKRIAEMNYKQALETIDESEKYELNQRGMEFDGFVNQITTRVREMYISEIEEKERTIQHILNKQRANFERSLDLLDNIDITNLAQIENITEVITRRIDSSVRVPYENSSSLKEHNYELNDLLNRYYNFTNEDYPVNIEYYSDDLIKTYYDYYANAIEIIDEKIANAPADQVVPYQNMKECMIKLVSMLPIVHNNPERTREIMAEIDDLRARARHQQPTPQQNGQPTEEERQQMIYGVKRDITIVYEQYINSVINRVRSFLPKSPIDTMRLQNGIKDIIDNANFLSPEEKRLVGSEALAEAEERLIVNKYGQGVNQFIFGNTYDILVDKIQSLRDYSDYTQAFREEHAQFVSMLEQFNTTYESVGILLNYDQRVSKLSISFRDGNLGTIETDVITNIMVLDRLNNEPTYNGPTGTLGGDGGSSSSPDPAPQRREDFPPRRPIFDPPTGASNIPPRGEGTDLGGHHEEIEPRVVTPAGGTRQPYTGDTGYTRTNRPPFEPAPQPMPYPYEGPGIFRRFHPETSDAMTLIQEVSDSKAEAIHNYIDAIEYTNLLVERLDTLNIELLAQTPFTVMTSASMAETVIKEREAKEIEEEIKEVRLRLSKYRLDFKMKHREYILQNPAVQNIELAEATIEGNLEEFISIQDSLIVEAEEEIRRLADEREQNKQDPYAVSNITLSINELINYIEAKNSFVNRRLMSEAKKDKSFDVVSVLKQRREAKANSRAMIRDAFNKGQTMGFGMPIEPPRTGGYDGPVGGPIDEEDLGSSQHLDEPTSEPKARVVRLELNIKDKDRPFQIDRMSAHVENCQPFVINRYNAQIVTIEDGLKYVICKNKLKIMFSNDLKEKLQNLSARISLVNKKNPDLTSVVPVETTFTEDEVELSTVDGSEIVPEDYKIIINADGEEEFVNAAIDLTDEPSVTRTR